MPEPQEAAAEPATPSQDLVVPAEEQSEQLARFSKAPIIDQINKQQLALIKATVAERASDAEVAMFLELCAGYGLDPFAKEAWCAKGKGRDGGEGRLLIMVGRDGLRKIAQRQGLLMDGDVVREKDEFKIRRGPDGERSIEHSYGGSAAARGEIVGAWCEVRERRRHIMTGAPMQGRARGFFFAPLDEYRPTDAKKLQYSPWGSQESVMILAAAERQALRQATPLSGLLAEGEMDLNDERALAAVEGSESSLPPEVEEILARATALGHVGLSDRASAEMALLGQDAEEIKAWLARAEKELDVMERAILAAPVEEIEVKGPEEPEPEAEAEAEAEPEPEPEPDSAPEDEPAEPEEAKKEPSKEEAGPMRKKALALLDAADQADERGDSERALDLRDEAEALHAEAQAHGDPAQDTLGGF